MRIVSIAPSNTEILFALGAGEEVVATTSLCDYPREAARKPSVGGWSRGVDFRRIEGLEPDLVLASDDLQDEVVEELVDRNLHVEQFNPHTLEDVYRSIEEIGELARRKRRAEELVTGMKERLSRLTLPGSPRIYCEEWSEPPMVSGNWVPGIVESIGGEYFIEEGERSREFEKSELIDFDPEYIFLNICGAGTNTDESAVLNRQDWGGVTALEEGNVFRMDDSLLNRAGPRLAEGAEKMINIVEGGDT